MLLLQPAKGTEESGPGPSRLQIQNSEGCHHNMITSQMVCQGRSGSHHGFSCGTNSVMSSELVVSIAVTDLRTTFEFMCERFPCTQVRYWLQGHFRRGSGGATLQVVVGEGSKRHMKKGEVKERIISLLDRWRMQWSPGIPGRIQVSLPEVQLLELWPAHVQKWRRDVLE